jgi:hypothetical protein
MSAKYRSSVHRRVEWQWAEGIKSLGQILGKIVVETKRALQRVFAHDDVLIPIPVRVIADRRRLDPYRRRD